MTHIIQKPTLLAVGLLAFLTLLPLIGLQKQHASFFPAEKGKYLIAVREGGKVSFKNKPALMKAVQGYLGSGYKVLEAGIKPKAGKPALVFVFQQVATGGKGVLGFELVADGKNIYSSVTPGQKCSGDPCSECAFQNDGWGCQCNDDSDDGHCNHETTSALDPIIAEVQGSY